MRWFHFLKVWAWTHSLPRILRTRANLMESLTSNLGLTNKHMLNRHRVPARVINLQSSFVVHGCSVFSNKRTCFQDKPMQLCKAAFYTGPLYAAAIIYWIIWYYDKVMIMRSSIHMMSGQPNRVLMVKTAIIITIVFRVFPGHTSTISHENGTFWTSAQTQNHRPALQLVR